MRGYTYTFLWIDATRKKEERQTETQRKKKKEASKREQLSGYRFASLSRGEGLANGKRIQKASNSDGEAVVSANKYHVSLFAASWNEKVGPGDRARETSIRSRNG